MTTGFDRPNLSFAVVRAAGAADKRARIAAALAEPGALPAIVYAGTRGACDELAGFLSQRLGVEVPAYHAGLDRGTRTERQERFMAGECPVIVATNAFGMGVDKADVRTVCHATVPGSLEAYYQEAGRAGRDGRPARCLLFAEQRDKGLHVFFIQRSELPDDAFERLAERLRWAGLDGRYDVELAELAASRRGQGRRGRRAGDDRTPGPRGSARSGSRPAGPRRRPCAGRLRPARAVGLSHLGPRRPARALGPVPDSSGSTSRAIAAGARVCSPTSATRPRRAPEVPCCDVCVGTTRAWAQTGTVPRARLPLVALARVAARPRPTARRLMPAASTTRSCRSWRPPNRPVGRTRAVEILRGGRSKVIEQHAYDGLPGYGAFGWMRSDDVLARVDGLLHSGALRSTGGRFPKLRAA